MERACLELPLIYTRNIENIQKKTMNKLQNYSQNAFTPTSTTSALLLPLKRAIVLIWLCLAVALAVEVVSLN